MIAVDAPCSGEGMFRKDNPALEEWSTDNVTANTSFSRRWLNLTCGILLPLGLVFWFRIWRFRIRLFRDLKVVEKQNERLQGFIQKIILKQDNQE